jgi:hypothetical protein
MTDMRAVAAAVVLCQAACGGSKIVDPEPVPADYTSWSSIETTEPVPGHGDSYRIIYANPEAELLGVPIYEPPPDAGPDDPDASPLDPGGDVDTDVNYRVGSIIVKEVRERNGDQPGDIKYIGVMRKLVEAPSGAELHKSSKYSDGGWLFTYLADDINSDEEYRSSCWDECHVAAPIDGTFYDYGR